MKKERAKTGSLPFSSVPSHPMNPPAFSGARNRIVSRACRRMLNVNALFIINIGIPIFYPRNGFFSIETSKKTVFIFFFRPF